MTNRKIRLYLLGRLWCFLHKEFSRLAFNFASHHMPHATQIAAFLDILAGLLATFSPSTTFGEERKQSGKCRANLR